MVKTHLECSRIGFRNTISLSGLRSDGRQMGFRWASDASPMSLRCASNDSLRAEDWVGIAPIIQPEDRLQIAPWRCKDLVILKVPWPDAADQGTGLLWSRMIESSLFKHSYG